MNFRNYSMDELAEYITNESEQSRFITACKAFIEKWFDQKHYSQDEVDELIEEAKEEAEQKGYDDCRKVCQDEMVERLELMPNIDEGPRDQLLHTAKLLG